MGAHIDLSGRVSAKVEKGFSHLKGVGASSSERTVGRLKGARRRLEWAAREPPAARLASAESKCHR